MDPKPSEKSYPDVDRIVLALAKTFHWAGLYGEEHPVLGKRAEEMCAALRDQAASEPAGRLLLGIARDKVLYRDAFLGRGQELIGKLCESLYLRQVATVVFDGDVDPAGLLGLFRHLHRSRDDREPPSPEEFLRRSGIRGISLSPYNYRELLARKLVDAGAPVPESGNREEHLWRLLLAPEGGKGDGENQLLEEVTEFPELIRAITRRAREAESADAPRGPVMTPEVMGRLVRRIGALLRSLPPERRGEILSLLDEEPPDPAGSPAPGEGSFDHLLARSISDEIGDDEFLDLLGSLVSAEGKGGGRYRKIFEALAADRDIRGSLLPKAAARGRESAEVKNYYDRKTWEAVETLLLSRSEQGYLGDDYARFLDDISQARKPYADRLAGEAPPDPSFLSALGEDDLRRRGTRVLLELLSRESRDEEFADLLEEIRKAIPNIISRKDIPLLQTVLASLEAISRSVAPERQNLVRAVLLETDFGLVADLFLSGGSEREASRATEDLVATFGAAAARPLLDRLLHESEAARRRALLKLMPRMGSAALPEILERMTHPKWYYVRNLCIVLGEIGDRRAVPALIKASAHPEHRVKREAILAVGKLKAPEAVSCLGKILLEDGLFATARDEQLRIDAASSLYRIGGAEAVAYLHKGKAARRPAVRAHCEGLLRSLATAR